MRWCGRLRRAREWRGVAPHVFWHRRRVKADMLRVMILLGLVLLGSGVATPAAVAQEPPQPSCNPRILVQRFGSGETEMAGAGEAYAPRIVLTDISGAPLPDTSGTINWSYQAYAREATGRPRVSHDIRGHLELEIGTAGGHRISFRSHCLAGAGTVGLPSDYPGGYTLLYADGIAKGWPISATNPSRENRAHRTFIHFEAVQNPDGGIEIYVALVNGKDCALNHDVVLWTPDLAYGSGSYSATNRTSYIETDCGLLNGPGRSLAGSPVGLGRIGP